MQYIQFMKLAVLPTLAAQTQPWTTLWIAQPAEVPGAPGAPPAAWAANVQYGNYSQVRPGSLLLCLWFAV
jgi:hypothetical protein